MLANYQTDETGRLQSITTYPLDEEKPTIELPPDFGKASIRDYVVQGGTFAYSPLPPTEPTAQERITALKKQLADTDYVVIKIAEGAATTDEYAEIITQRQQWRAEINELEGN